MLQATRQRAISSCKDTIKQLQQETLDFIGPDLWPPNSPDLNLVDYKVRDVMQQRVYECRMNSVDELKQCLTDVWNSLQKNVIDTDHGHQRLEKGKRKGKENYLYNTFLHQGTHKALRHGSHSFTCKQHHACLPSWRSPDVTTTATEAADIQLQLTTHLSTPKG